MATSSSCGICKQQTSSPNMWCPDCDLPLCASCHKQHGRSNNFINHKPRPVGSCKKIPPSILTTEFYCEEHKEKFYKYCNIHALPVCKKCLLKTHVNCKDLKTIENVVQNAKSSVAYEALQQNLEDVMHNLQLLTKNRQDNLSKLKEQKRVIKQQVSNFRRQLNQTLDKMETALLDELADVVNKKSYEISTICQEMTTKESNIRKIKNDIDIVMKDGTEMQTFFAIRHFDKMVYEVDRRLQLIIETDKISDYTIRCSIDKHLEAIKEENSKFGTIELKTKPTGISIVRGNAREIQIPVRDHLPKISLVNQFGIQKVASEPNNITAFCILPSGSFVFLDRIGRIIIYNNEGSFICDFKVKIAQEHEADMTPKDEETVAISAGYFIYLIDIFKQRTLKKISVPGGYGLRVFKDEIFLHCVYGYGIWLRDLNDLESQWWDLQFPGYVVIFNDKVCVTDYYGDTVYLLDSKANLIWKFEDKKVLSSTAKIAADGNGNFYVIGRASKNVVFISHDGKHCRQILGKDDLQTEPWGDLTGIQYDIKTDRLILVNMFGKVVVYNIQKKSF